MNPIALKNKKTKIRGKKIISPRNTLVNKETLVNLWSAIPCNVIIACSNFPNVFFVILVVYIDFKFRKFKNKSPNLLNVAITNIYTKIDLDFRGCFFHAIKRFQCRNVVSPSECAIDFYINCCNLIQYDSSHSKNGPVCSHNDTGYNICNV